MLIKPILTEASYWDTVDKMWGTTAATAVHWAFNAVFIGAVMVGLFFVVFHIISVTMHEMKENDKSVGEALKLGMNGMVKFIILIVVAAIAIPLVWELLFPFLISQGYNPEVLN